MVAETSECPLPFVPRASSSEHGSVPTSLLGNISIKTEMVAHMALLGGQPMPPVHEASV